MLKGFGPQMMDNLATPIMTTGGKNQYGQEYGSFLPQAQTQNKLQQQAIQQFLNQQGMGTAQFDPKTGGFTGISGTGTGIAGYQPFLDDAATAFNAAQAAAASGQDAGAQYMAPGAYQQFMDPYQQDVINASLAQFDRQSGQQARDAGLAAAKGSAYGTERFGVQEGSRQAQSMTANMLAQGYQQARQQANTAFQQANLQAQQNVNMLGQAGQGQQNLAQGLQGQAAQNLGLFQSSAQGQQGMAQLQPQLAMQGIGALGQFGTQQQQQGQAILDTQAKGNQMTAFQPQQGLGFFGSQLAKLMGGYGTPNTYTSAPPAPAASPMSTLLSGIGAGAGIGQLFGFGS